MRRTPQFLLTIVAIVLILVSQFRELQPVHVASATPLKAVCTTIGAENCRGDSNSYGMNQPSCDGVCGHTQLILTAPIAMPISLAPLLTSAGSLAGASIITSPEPSPPRRDS